MKQEISLKQTDSLTHAKRLRPQSLPACTRRERERARERERERLKSQYMTLLTITDSQR